MSDHSRKRRQKLVRLGMPTCCATRVAPLGELDNHMYQRVVDFDEANASMF